MMAFEEQRLAVAHRPIGGGGGQSDLKCHLQSNCDPVFTIQFDPGQV